MMVILYFSKLSTLFTEQRLKKILLAYGIPQKSLSGIMILYKNTEACVCSPNGNVGYFDILAGVLQGKH